MSNPKLIFYEKTAEPNTVVLHVPVHYPGTYQQEDETDPKKRLYVLKRAKHRINAEIKSAEARIEAEAIKQSGQVDIETAIKNEENGRR